MRIALHPFIVFLKNSTYGYECRYILLYYSLSRESCISPSWYVSHQVRLNWSHFKGKLGIEEAL